MWRWVGRTVLYDTLGPRRARRVITVASITMLVLFVLVARYEPETAEELLRSAIAWWAQAATRKAQRVADLVQDWWLSTTTTTTTTTTTVPG